MITNTSLPHSTLKKQVSANNYHHRVKEEVASKIASVVHCNTKYDLADMGTKSLNGAVHQFLLQNQNFPPGSIAGECQMDTKKKSGVAISGMAKYAHT
eukprot:14962013-Ditylum_brightwellii.AAC.1